MAIWFGAYEAGPVQKSSTRAEASVCLVHTISPGLKTVPGTPVLNRYVLIE